MCVYWHVWGTSDTDHILTVQIPTLFNQNVYGLKDKKKTLDSYSNNKCHLLLPCACFLPFYFISIKPSFIAATASIHATAAVPSRIIGPLHDNGQKLVY